MLYKLSNNFSVKYLLSISAIVGGYLALILIDATSNHQHITLCAFKLITSIPCPGCGMGRATLCLFRGDIAASFQYNILCIPFTLAIIVTLLWLVIDVIKRKDTFFPFVTRDFKIQYKVLLATIILIDWAVNIVRGV